MCLATIGFYGSKGPFWPLPSTFLTGTAAAAGMALINSVGNVHGFMGPFVVGWIKDSTGSFANGLYALAGFMVLAAVVTVAGVQAPRRWAGAYRCAGDSRGIAGDLEFRR